MIEKAANTSFAPCLTRFVRSNGRTAGFLLLLVMLCMPLYAEAQGMKIQLTVAGRTLTATLDDNPTSRDFVNLLPLTIVLEDYARTEKIVYLDRKLTTEGAPEGVDPAVGDITYYAPWGNLALFYKDFGYSKGLIKIGSIDNGMEIFSAPGSISVTIEAM